MDIKEIINKRYAMPAGCVFGQIAAMLNGSFISQRIPGVGKR